MHRHLRCDSAGCRAPDSLTISFISRDLIKTSGLLPVMQLSREILKAHPGGLLLQKLINSTLGENQMLSQKSRRRKIEQLFRNLLKGCIVLRLAHQGILRFLEDDVWRS